MLFPFFNVFLYKNKINATQLWTYFWSKNPAILFADCHVKYENATVINPRDIAKQESYNLIGWQLNLNIPTHIP